MTALDRIFLRRHEAAFKQIDPRKARWATIRAGFAWGIRPLEIARFLKVHHATVYNAIHDRRPALTQLTLAKLSVLTARRRLYQAQQAVRIAEGKQRAAEERVMRHGYERATNEAN